jgi:hypothetical protein
MSPPVRRPASLGFGLGTVLAVAGVGLVAVALVGWRRASPSRGGRRPARQPTKAGQRAALKVRNGAAILGTSVLLDSATEHFRGGYHNRAMYTAPLTAAVSVAASLAESQPGQAGTLTRFGHALSMAVGLAGLAFHVYNVAKRPGGFSWNNLFYAAPLGAPGALTLAGLLGLAAEAPAALRRERHRAAEDDALRHREAGRVLALITGASLLAETGEVWLLHFRGAFHNPVMYLPVTVPPAAAVLLLAQGLSPGIGGPRLARQVLQATAALGFIGTGFHSYGVQRNMGGWTNWRQTVLAGPPIPAPISFTGLALAGLAALDLLSVPRTPGW